MEVNMPNKLKHLQMYVLFSLIFQNKLSEYQEKIITRDNVIQSYKDVFSARNARFVYSRYKYSSFYLPTCLVLGDDAHACSRDGMTVTNCSKETSVGITTDTYIPYFDGVYYFEVTIRTKGYTS